MIILIALFAVLPTDQSLVDHVDLIEVNHYHDSQGRLIFDQVIFYDWSQAAACFRVRAWRLLKSSDQVPRKDWPSGRWVSRWLDNGTLRKVVANGFRETWTTYDPELVDRGYLPSDDRRGLADVN